MKYYIHVLTKLISHISLDFVKPILHFMTLLTVMQEGWCDSVGSVEQIHSKLLKRQEAAAKRERAMAYALAHQVK